MVLRSIRRAARNAAARRQKARRAELERITKAFEGKWKNKETKSAYVRSLRRSLLALPRKQRRQAIKEIFEISPYQPFNHKSDMKRKVRARLLDELREELDQVNW